MHSAAQTQYTKRLSRSDQLKAVSEEAEAIWKKHREGKITSDDAAQQLKALQNRYSSFFDRLLAM
jgi:hypothetical protein